MNEIPLFVVTYLFFQSFEARLCPWSYRYITLSIYFQDIWKSQGHAKLGTKVVEWNLIPGLDMWHVCLLLPSSKYGFLMGKRQMSFFADISIWGQLEFSSPWLWSKQWYYRKWLRSIKTEWFYNTYNQLRVLFSSPNLVYFKFCVLFLVHFSYIYSIIFPSTIL